MPSLNLALHEFYEYFYNNIQLDGYNILNIFWEERAECFIQLA